MRTHRRLLLALLASLCLSALPGPAHAEVSNWHKGMTFASWWYDAYLKSSTLTSLDQVAKLNAGWVAIVPHWYMKDQYSTTIYPETNAGTASDDSVRYIIRQAHARGLRVMLKPHVDPRAGGWRGSIRPSNASAWFTSYRSFILHYAKIATETGAELFCVGTELKSMSGSSYTSYWRSIVADVRNAYKGQLTYAANWGPKSWGEYYMVQWWDALDFIGVDAYFPLTKATYPTVDQLKAGWYSYIDRYGQTHRWVDDMKALSTKFGKKVLFTEIGFNSVANPGAEWDQQTGTDMNAHKNAFEATFQVFDRESWMSGVFWWTWSIDPNDGGTSDRGMDINNKPAASTIANWFGRSSVDTTPPSTPSGLAAKALDSSRIGLQWSASTDNVGVAGYRIYRDGTLRGTSTTTSATDAGLAAGATYSYRVSAVDAAGNESGQSAAVSASTTAPADAQAPSTPTGLTASAVSSSQIALRWNASTDNVGVAGYHVYRNNLKVATVSPTSHTDSGLSAGTTYAYQVQAFDATGNVSALSGAVGGTTAPANATTGYDFETDAQGWFHDQRITGSWTSGSVKYEGNRSLALYADAMSTTSMGYAAVVPSAGLGAGRTVTLMVYLKAGSTNVAARAYVQDGTKRWTTGPLMTLKPWGWTQLTVTVPSAAKTPLYRLGIQFMTKSGTFTGYLNVDSVRW